MEKNIIFTWMPWSGKTTLWKKLIKETWYDFVDFDDDVLEQIKISTAENIIDILNLRSENIIPEDIAYTEVKDILRKIWDKKFIELEWYLAKQLKFEKPTILSTSWSLPINIDSMDYLRENWKVIYIDTKLEEILNRLEIMKTDRIVWMWELSLKEILEYREGFYKKTKDYSFTPPKRSLWMKKSNDLKHRDEVFERFMVFFREYFS